MRAGRWGAALLLVVVMTLYAGAGPSVAAEQSGPAARMLYVTNSGMIVPDGPPDGPHGTGVFTIGRTGRLTPLGDPAPGVTQPREIVFSPTGRSAYIADSGGDTVAPYRVGADGTLAPLSPPVPSGGDRPFGIAVTPNGRTVYVSHFLSHDVSAFTVTATGSLSPLGLPVPLGHDNGKGVAVTPDGRFLFVATGTPTDSVPDVVMKFAIRPDGALQGPGRPTPIGASGAGISISPDGRFLYVACQGSDEIHGFRIDQDGNLTPLAGMPVSAPDFTEGVAVAPNGRLYVTSLGGQQPDQDGVWVFAIGADGSLTRLGERVATGDGPGSVVATPDARHLYVSNFRSDDVSAFDILPTGRLREITGSPFPSGGEGPAFGAVMVSPNQGPVASFVATPRPAGRPTLFDATTSADPDGQVVRDDWDVGDGTSRANAGPEPTHVYPHAGTFTVTVTITDNEGCSTQFVFSGQSPLCTGSSAARFTRTLVITLPGWRLVGSRLRP